MINSKSKLKNEPFQCEQCYQENTFSVKEQGCSHNLQTIPKEPITTLEILPQKQLLRLFSFSFCLLISLFSIFLLIASTHCTTRFVASFVAILLVSLYCGIQQILQHPTVMANKQEGTITIWWGLYFPLRKKVYNFQDVDSIEVAKQITYQDKGNPVIYLPKIHLKNVNKSIKLEFFKNYELARQEAKKLATFINVGLLDTSQQMEIYRPASTLTDNLQTRLQKLNNLTNVSSLPSEPNSSNILYDINPKDNTSIFILPAQGFNKSICKAIFSSTILIMIGIIPVLIMGKDLSATLIVSIIGLAVLYVSLRNATLTQKIILNSQDFTLEKSSCFGNSSERMSISELDEFEAKSLIPSKTGDSAIDFIVIGNRKVIKFSHLLSEETAKWLVKAVKQCFVFDKNLTEKD